MNDWHTALDIVLGVSNVLMLVILTSVKADIANVKVYMHEKFITRKEFDERD